MQGQTNILMDYNRESPAVLGEVMYDKVAHQNSGGRKDLLFGKISWDNWVSKQKRETKFLPTYTQHSKTFHVNYRP